MRRLRDVRNDRPRFQPAVDSCSARGLRARRSRASSARRPPRGRPQAVKQPPVEIEERLGGPAVTIRAGPRRAGRSAGPLPPGRSMKMGRARLRRAEDRTAPAAAPATRTANPIRPRRVSLHRHASTRCRAVSKSAAVHWRVEQIDAPPRGRVRSANRSRSRARRGTEDYENRRPPPAFSGALAALGHPEEHRHDLVDRRRSSQPWCRTRRPERSSTTGSPGSPRRTSAKTSRSTARSDARTSKSIWTRRAGIAGA